MNWLYLLLNIGSISIPFLFSFHPKLKFYKYWKALFPAIIIMMFVFIPWDIYFTAEGYWGFNPEYFIGTKILHLPLEEWLFFICIPYACVFTHYALLVYFPNMQLDVKTTRLISALLFSVLLIILFFNFEKAYPLFNYGLALILIPLALKYHLSLLRNYYLTFLVMLIPFFLVNGILTGSFIQDEVVWYNNAENLGIRMFTIPVEDSIYAFSMILLTLMFTEYFRREKKKTA